MELRTIVWAVVVVGAAALAVERAITWPIGHDEALTWSWYVVEPWSVGLTSFDANHHVLFTWLAKLSAAVFGDDTWCLRLPSMVAVVVYQIACARLAARSSRSLPFALGVFALMSLGPRTFEYGFAARGYGGALAALALAVVVLRPGSRGIAVGAALGVCVAFNLSFAWAALGVGLGAWCAGVVDSRAVARMASVGGAIVALVCGAPLAHASAAAFYFGAAGFGPFADSLFFDGLRQRESQWLLWLLTGSAPVQHYETLRAGMRVAVAVVFVVIVARAGARLRRGRDGDSARVPGLALAIAVACAGIAYGAFGLPLPRERTALWIAVLAPLAWAELARGPGAARGLARFACIVLAVVLVLRTLFASSFSEWWADRHSIATFEAIRDDAASRHRSGTVLVGCDWRLEPSLRHAARRDRTPRAFDVARSPALGANAAGAEPRRDEYLVLFADRAPEFVALPGVTVLRRFEGTVVLRLGE